jgi:hypothetical protein
VKGLCFFFFFFFGAESAIGRDFRLKIATVKFFEILTKVTKRRFPPHSTANLLAESVLTVNI